MNSLRLTPTLVMGLPVLLSLSQHSSSRDLRVPDPQSWNPRQHGIWPEDLLHSEGVGDSPWQRDPLVASHNTIWRLPAGQSIGTTSWRHSQWARSETLLCHNGKASPSMLFKSELCAPREDIVGLGTKGAKRKWSPFTFITSDPPVDFVSS